MNQFIKLNPQYKYKIGDTFILYREVYWSIKQCNAEIIGQTISTKYSSSTTWSKPQDIPYEIIYTILITGEITLRIEKYTQSQLKELIQKSINYQLINKINHDTPSS